LLDPLQRRGHDSVQDVTLGNNACAVGRANDVEGQPRSLNRLRREYTDARTALIESADRCIDCVNELRLSEQL